VLNIDAAFVVSNCEQVLFLNAFSSNERCDLVNAISQHIDPVIPCEAKKLHRFIFVMALSKLCLL